MLQTLQHWLSDPPPSLIFEITETGVALARLGPKSRLPAKLVFEPLAPGAVESSPVRENVHQPDELDRALRQALQQVGPLKKNRDAALLLPDNCARIAVLDFENLPGDAKERLSLIRFRIKKTVPFDADTAAIAYQVQKAAKGYSVLAAVSPVEVIAQYEAAIRRLDLNPGYVSVSAAAALNLLEEHGLTMLAKLAGRILSVVIVGDGQVRLVRSLDAGLGPDGLTEAALREMAADLYPTFVYVSDNFGAPVSNLVVAGFGPALALAAEVFRRELGCEPQPLKGPQGVVDAHSAGIWGFLSAN